MLKNGVCKNRYYKNIEGKQAVKYRKNWNKITQHFGSSTYRQNMVPAMKHLNKFMRICNKSNSSISASKIQKAQNYIIYIYIGSLLDHMDVWGHSVEGNHKISSKSV